MYKPNPFGNPDGARADISEISNFIMGIPNAVDFNVTTEYLLSKRVIIGAKGSGKTIFLRKIQAMLKDKAINDQTGIFVDEIIDQNLNCTDIVIKFCDFFKRQILSEKWTQIWKAAIRISIALKYVNDINLSSYIPEEDRKKLISALEYFNLLFDDCLSAYKVFQILLYDFNTANDVNKKLDSRHWIIVNSILAKYLRVSPTIYLFLDSIDIEYEHAPAHWLTCQKGLFYAVMDMLQEKIWGEKLHIVMSMRSNVFSSVLRSEHSTKFSYESHILFLNWNYINMRHFITQKICFLDDCFFVDIQSMKRNGKTIESWLGSKTINNVKRNIEEGVLDYIIRHTRLVPRDAIIICNQLSVINKQKELNTDMNIFELIRKYIEECSLNFGNELLTICAKSINSFSIPSGAGRQNYSDAFTANEIFNDNTYTFLKNVLSQLESDRPDYDALYNAELRLNNAITAESHLIDVLWINNALGYINDEGKAQYFILSSNNDPILPKNKHQYILRSCLIDALSLESYFPEPERIA